MVMSIQLTYAVLGMKLLFFSFVKRSIALVDTVASRQLSKAISAPYHACCKEQLVARHPCNSLLQNFRPRKQWLTCDVVSQKKKKKIECFVCKSVDV